MATGPGVNQGKTAFVENFLATHGDANLEAVKQAWMAAGNEGTVSDSLVGKIRAKLGLTTKRTEAASEPATPAKPAKATLKIKKGAKRGPKPRTQANGTTAAPSPSAHTPAHEHDDDTLDELEEGIDELIQKFRELGGKPEVVKALRRARRLLVRGHQG
jgi:hypothetical protein